MRLDYMQAVSPFILHLELKSMSHSLDCLQTYPELVNHLRSEKSVKIHDTEWIIGLFVCPVNCRNDISYAFHF